MRSHRECAQTHSQGWIKLWAYVCLFEKDLLISTYADEIAGIPPL